MSRATSPAIGGYSPVSYFEKNTAEEGRPEHQVRHNGQTYYFASADQVTKFNADPERFVPAFGGSCAFGRSIGQTFEPDPKSFKIVDGRLLLFLKSDEVDALTLWNQEGDTACMNKAQRNWARSLSR